MSVVVPTLGRPAAVRRLIGTLVDACAFYPGEAEIIVSDASDGTEAESIRRVSAQHGARLVAGPAGISGQRNLGCRAATGEIVVMIDSDCVATPGLLRALVGGFRDPSVVAVAGRVRFAGPRSLPLDAAIATGVVASFDGFGSAAGKRVPWGVTANLAVRHRALAAIGGFDERLPAGEDVDLGLRLCSGGEIRYAPQALVEHRTETWNRLDTLAARFFRYGRADAHLRRAHAGVRGGIEPLPWLSIVVALLATAWRGRRDRGSAWSPMLACFAALVGMLALPEPKGRRAESVLAAALMECLSVGRAVEAVRLGRWGDLCRGVVLDEGQREREAGARRRRWLATVAAALAAVVARTRR